jgi:hypothetical protein
VGIGAVSHGGGRFARMKMIGCCPLAALQPKKLSGYG